ncbi:MFS transporter [Streptomyces sp. A1136]|uniref:MFS transporter n=1 Tax=Streptomyces sp. A1136 TaxID=2563102 RepID=UPI00109E8253|nr:MFS transporter [Streptomyces sp. A1136]THA54602.1 MFS transporter [Streptomyces sp. A1136]
MTTTASVPAARTAEPATEGAAPPAALSRRVRVGYASGALASGTFTTLPGLLLLPYLTDTLGIGAALAGVAVLVPKAWVALVNPVVGRLSDRTRSRWGARGPWVLGGGLAMALAFALMFAGLARGAAGAWVTEAGFLLTATAFACFQIPYAALPAELAPPGPEQVRLVGGRVVALGLAALTAGAVAPALIDAGGGGVAGHRWAGLFGGTVIAAGALGVFLAARSVPAEPVLHSASGIRLQLAVARGNRPFMALLRAAAAQTVATGVLLAGTPYAAAQVLPGPGWAGALVAVFVAPNLISTPVWSRLGARIGPRRAYSAACALFGAGCLLFLAAPLLPPAAVLATMALAGAGHAGQLLFLYALLPDCIARETARTGTRQGGVLAGLFSTAEAIGLALGPFLYAVVLQAFGYLSSDSGQAAEQSSLARFGVLTGMAVVPVLATTAAVALLRAYRPGPAGAGS